MHFHLPKPMHGWREFVGEVGIIVLGVLIALSAEQLIERWTWQRKVEETKTQLDTELHRDVKSAYSWMVIAPCVDRQLAAIDAALTLARETGRLEPTPPLTPSLEEFTEDTWLNARALQVADHMSPETIAHYSSLFFLPRDLGGSVVELHKEAAEFRSLSAGLSPISRDEIGAYQRQSGRIHELLDRVELGATLLIRYSKIELSPEEKSQLLEANRRWAGQCASPPDLNRTFAPGDI
jgi:hypothetical protein